MAGLNLFTNNAATTLASGILIGATSLTVAAGTGAEFPTLTGSEYFYCTLANNTGSIEIIKVTARSTDTFTIVRGQDGTSAAAWSAGDKVELRLTRIDLLNFPQLDSTNTFAQAQTFSAGITSTVTPLGVTSGGTGLGTLTANNVILGNGTSTPTFVAPSTAGNVLQSNGTTWTSAAVPSSNGGATVTSSAVDITLTSSSNRVQNISMTASGKFVILPNATTLTAGGPIFVIQNAGLYNFGIKDAAGNILVNAISGSITPLFLTTTATSAGSWETSTVNLGLNISPPSFSTISMAGVYSANTNVKATALSSSLVVFAYGNAASSVVNLVAASVSGGVLTFGTPVAAHSATAVYVGGITKLSSTSGALATQVNNPPNQSTSIRGFSVSGTTITVGTATTLASTTVNNYQSITGICTLGNGTTGVVQYYDGSGQTNRLRAFTISGTTLTLGTAVTATSGGNTGQNSAITPLDSSTFVFQDNNNTRLGSVSGTTITLGTGNSTLIFNALNSGSFGGTAIVSATQFWNGGYLVTWTGNTISSVTPASTAYSGQGTNALAMPKYGSNFFNLNYNNDNSNTQTLGAQVANTSSMSSPIPYYAPATSKILPLTLEYIDASNMMIFGFDSGATQYLGAQLLTVL